MPTSRFSIYFDPDQPLLIRRWLNEQGVDYVYPAHELLVKVQSGEYTAVQPHDVVTHAMTAKCQRGQLSGTRDVVAQTVVDTKLWLDGDIRLEDFEP